MKKAFYLLLFSLAVLASCSDDEQPGNEICSWSAMTWQWIANASQTEPQISTSVITLNVAASGDTYSLRCTNYPSYWFCGTEEHPVVDDPHHSFTDDWVSSTISGDTVRIAVAPNTSAAPREKNVTVTAGDTFFYFHVTQGK